MGFLARVDLRGGVTFSSRPSSPAPSPLESFSSLFASLAAFSLDSNSSALSIFGSSTEAILSLGLGVASGIGLGGFKSCTGAGKTDFFVTTTAESDDSFVSSMDSRSGAFTSAVKILALGSSSLPFPARLAAILAVSSFTNASMSSMSGFSITDVLEASASFSARNSLVSVSFTAGLTGFSPGSVSGLVLSSGCSFSSLG